eukprot:4530538-Heterocapsa_arctica.AAC.1
MREQGVAGSLRGGADVPMICRPRGWRQGGERGGGSPGQWVPTVQAVVIGSGRGGPGLATGSPCIPS